jgi:hypothetical protein
VINLIHDIPVPVVGLIGTGARRLKSRTREVEVASALAERERRDMPALNVLGHNRRGQAKNDGGFFIPIGRNPLKSLDSKK